MRRPRRGSGRYGSLSLLGALLAIALPAPAGVETCVISAEPPGPVRPGAYADFRVACTGEPLGFSWSSSFGPGYAYCSPGDGPDTTCYFPNAGVATVQAAASYRDEYGGCYLVQDIYPMTVSWSAQQTCAIISTPRSPVQPGAWAELTAACTGNPHSHQWYSCFADCSPVVGPSIECRFPTTGVSKVSVIASWGGCFFSDDYAMYVGFSAPPTCRITASPAGPLQPGAWADVAAECTAVPSSVSWDGCMAWCTPMSGPVVSCGFLSEPYGSVSAIANFPGGQWTSDYVKIQVSHLAAPTCSIRATPPGPVDPGGTATMDAGCVGSPTAIDWSSDIANCTPHTGPTTVCTFQSIGTSVVRASATYPYGAGSSLVAVDEYPMKVSGASCTYAVAPLDLANTPAGGGQQTVTVTTPGGCPVTARSFQPWVTIAAIEPNGATTTVRLAFSPNTGPPRATAVELAGRLYLVSQLSP
jgi:hypothetical protein